MLSNAHIDWKIMPGRIYLLIVFCLLHFHFFRWFFLFFFIILRFLIILMMILIVVICFSQIKLEKSNWIKENKLLLLLLLRGIKIMLQMPRLIENLYLAGSIFCLLHLNFFNWFFLKEILMMTMRMIIIIICWS